MSTVRIQVRRGISTDWSTVNPILAAGEIGFESNTKKVKIGDGTTSWNSLDYISSDVPVIDEIAQDAVNSALVMGNGLSKVYNDTANTITLNNTGVLSFNTRTGAVTLSGSDVNTALGYTAADAAALTTLGNNTAQDIADAITTAETYTDTSISNLIDSAPALLNTLNELASALNNDENFANTVLSDISTTLSNAHSYTDSAISTEVFNRNTAIAASAGTVSNSASAYTDTQASLTLNAANYYTDGAITTEINDRNNAITFAISSAIA